MWNPMINGQIINFMEIDEFLNLRTMDFNILGENNEILKVHIHFVALVT